MNAQILNQYGISFSSQFNGYFKISANSPDLAIYLDKFSSNKSELSLLICNIDLALKGEFSKINEDDIEWSKELGTDIYTGIIKEDLKFHLFIEDHYEETLEIFPLFDIKEILTSLNSFLINSASP